MKLFSPLRIIGLFISTMLTAPVANSAINLDRTRVIFNENEQSTTVMLSNQNVENPFLAQSWLTDENRNKISTPLLVLPALQRIEPKGHSLISLVKTGQLAQLPKDRESLFYLNVREIPPKPEKANVLQIAIQSEIKVFFRPQQITPAKGEIWQNKLTITKSGKQFRIENPTPYYITVSNILQQSKNTHQNPTRLLVGNAFMVSPKGSIDVDVTDNRTNQFFLYYVNDYGGHLELTFTCTQNRCQSVTL